jgi:hypothetical protein
MEPSGKLGVLAAYPHNVSTNSPARIKHNIFHESKLCAHWLNQRTGTNDIFKPPLFGEHGG